ncbi:VOC family protein [Pseudonocardia lacus]|uniref:VOC family protein n=1 Tax=Pseudonocardia lacus TaxID=2835865 RepID=UPI001BDC4954|nr:VOC family protein [Pseudonocardia lacus]
MAVDLFAGIYVSDHAAALAWYARLHTVFVDDFDARVAAIAERGIEPVEREAYPNGARKALFRDPDGNEIGFGGGPA